MQSGLGARLGKGARGVWLCGLREAIMSWFRFTGPSRGGITVKVFGIESFPGRGLVPQTRFRPAILPLVENRSAGMHAACSALLRLRFRRSSSTRPSARQPKPRPTPPIPCLGQQRRLRRHVDPLRSGPRCQRQPDHQSGNRRTVPGGERLRPLLHRYGGANHPARRHHQFLADGQRPDDRADFHHGRNSSQRRSQRRRQTRTM